MPVPNQQLKGTPPLGGADLECFLSCRTLSASSIDRVVAIVQSHGFELVSGDAVLVYREDLLEPAVVARRDEVQQVVKTIQAQAQSLSRCIVNFEGRVGDIATSLSVVFDFRYSVLEISIPEQSLWGPCTNPVEPDLGRLRRFGDVCLQLAESVEAELAFIGTEQLHSDEMEISVAAAVGAVRPHDALSEESLKSLCEWYSSVYFRRWQSPS